MARHAITIRSVEKITPDVLRIRTDRPEGYTFEAGQATEVGINKDGWKEELRPFTFTCLPQDSYLEFTIKTYPAHKGVTAELLELRTNDQLTIGESWGTIGYKGPGAFIAGGAGVTPFISIFRKLKVDDILKGNKLIFANKTEADIIHRSEFNDMLGNNFINILSDEKKTGYAHGYITEDFLKKCEISPSDHVYLCGPQPMMDAVEQQLLNLGIRKELIVKEEF